MTTHQLTHDYEHLVAPPTRSMDAVVDYIAAQGFSESVVGRVGLELEFHVVDLRDPCRHISWAELTELMTVDSLLTHRCRLSLEPGGQLELSTPPLQDVSAAVAALRADRTVLGARLADRGLGLAAMGSDPARGLQRVNPASRYSAMEQHFDALGHGRHGRSMMTATAALQVNVDAGLRADWTARMRYLDRLVPVLGALSACSPVLAGDSSGWRSMRQQSWLGIDPLRAGPFDLSSDPDVGWALFALRAPVMLVRDPATATAEPVVVRVPFLDWWFGHADLGRPATLEDLDYHLTTLFPPVRPKGYIEFRPIDAVPDRWWPALAAIAVTLMDHPAAIEQVADVVDGPRMDWRHAAHVGLADSLLHRLVLRCVDIAAAYIPGELAADVARYRDLVASGRTPGDELMATVRRGGPIAALLEEARA